MQGRTIQILEEDHTLSQCRLWAMIEEYYGTAGPDAWKETPYYPTSNAFIGETYAELIVAFLRDYLPRLDRSQPVYILELATGSGAFSFFVLKALKEKLAFFASLRDLRLCYVMTDFAQSTIASWESEPFFQPFIGQGMLDFALYWPEIQDSITLQHSGTILDNTATTNPVIAIANYFFDSIRHDFFHVENGGLKETRLTLYRELDDQVHGNSPPLLSQVKLIDRYVSVSSNYYHDPALNDLLKYYQAHLDIGSFLFPIGAFHCLRRLRAMSNDRLLLLASDKGFHGIDYMRCEASTPYTPHTGSFSYMVNFHALGAYFQNLGGEAWHAQENYSITTMVGISFDADGLENLAYAASQLKTTDPIKNAFHLASFLDRFEPGPDCSETELLKIAVACIRLSYNDPWIFSRCGEYLCRGLAGMEYAAESDIVDLLDAVECNLYRMVVGCYEAYGYLRRLYYMLGKLDRALAINETCLALYGPDRDTCYYPAAIAEMRGNYRPALLDYRNALEYDPDSEHARAGIERMESLLATP